MTYNKEFLATKVRSRRAELNINQTDLANKAGVDKMTVVRLERGQSIPTAETLCGLSKALGVTPNQLLGWPSE